MKKLIFPFLVMANLFVLSAQMGSAYGNQRMGAPLGPEMEPHKEEPKTAEELVEAEMPKITEALELNAFEQAVVSSILTKYVQQRIELQILKLPKEQTMAALEKIAQDQNRELKQGLPVEKYEGFVELQENGYKGKKKRKKKKKNKT